MSDESIWTASVPLVEDGDPVNAQITNASDIVLAQRTAALKAMIDALEQGERIVLRNAPLGEGIDVGSIVYFDSAAFEHKKAEALWQNLDTAQARIEPSEKAIYTGLVIDKNTSRVGDILMSGVEAIDSTAISVLFNGETPTADVYFLSSLVPGTVQQDPPLMEVRALQYLGNDLVRVFPPTHSPITHTHKDFRLDKDDFLVASSFDPDIVPAGVTFGYDFTAASATDQNLSEILLPAVGEGTFVNTAPTGGSCADAGKHVEPGLIFIDENGIWWTDTAAPDCDILVTVTQADAKGIPILHTISSLTPDTLEIEVNNGKVEVSFLGFTEEPDTTGSVVIKDIVGDKKLRGPVVEKVLPGVGIKIAPASGQGVVTVELEQFNNLLIDAGLLNLNNAVTAVDAPFVFIKFPLDRTSAVSLRAILPNLNDDNLYEARIFAEFLAPGPSQSPPTIDDLVLKPTPDAAGVVPATAVTAVFPDFPSSIDSDKFYFVASTTAFDLAGLSRGTIFYTLNAVSPSPEFRMVTTGIILELK